MENILVIQTAFLGDLILTTPLFKKIKIKHPNSHVSVLVNRGTESILEMNPNLDRVIPVDKKSTFKNPFSFLKFLKFLRSLDFNICYSPHFSHRSSLVSFFSGSKLRIGYRESGFSFLHSITYERPLRGIHEVQKLDLLIGNSDFIRPEIFLNPKSIEDIVPYIANLPPYIAIAPSSLWETKRMPVEKFSDLILKILNKSEYLPVIIGSKSDIPLGKILSDRFSEKIINYVGKTNLQELSYIISRAKAVVSNDSSPIHIASAFNVPTIAIFGATIPEFGYSPLSDLKYVSQIELDCRPCGIHGGRFCPKQHFKCMMDQDINGMFDQLIYLTGKY